MRCPFCKSMDTQVVDSRSSEDGWVIRRRRKCPQCGKRFTTYERVEQVMPTVVKKGGSRCEYDRKKLIGSMLLALRKRPVPRELVDEAISRHNTSDSVAAVNWEYVGQVKQWLGQMEVIE